MGTRISLNVCQFIFVNKINCYNLLFCNMNLLHSIMTHYLNKLFFSIMLASVPNVHKSIRDDMTEFLKNITKLLDKANTIKALRHAHIYINYDVVSTVEQKDTPVRSKWQQ